MVSITEIAAPFVKYSSLLGGIASVVGDEPNYLGAVGFGVMYWISESVQRWNLGKVLTELSNNRIKNIESKVK